MQTVTNESLSFEQRNLLLGARSRHVSHSHRIVREMRRLGLVSDVLTLRNGNSAAVLTTAGEALRAQVVTAFDAAAAQGDMAILAFRFGQVAA